MSGMATYSSSTPAYTSHSTVKNR